MKNKILIIAVILTLGCLVLVILSSQKVGRFSEELNLERYSRMVAEEKLENAVARVKSLESDLKTMQDHLNSLQEALEKETRTSTGLKSELEMITKLKDILEQQLKEALVETPADGP